MKKKNTPSTSPYWPSLPWQTRFCKGAGPEWRALDLMKGVEDSSSNTLTIPPSLSTVAEIRIGGYLDKENEKLYL